MATSVQAFTSYEAGCQLCIYTSVAAAAYWTAAEVPTRLGRSCFMRKAGTHSSFSVSPSLLKRHLVFNFLVIADRFGD